jgi:hypothetical protein
MGSVSLRQALAPVKRLARRIQGNTETIRGRWFAQVCEFRLR